MKPDKLSLVAAVLILVTFIFPTWFLTVVWVKQLQFYFGAREVSVLVQNLAFTKKLSWGGGHGNQTLVTVDATARLEDGRIIHLGRIYVTENLEDREELKRLIQSKGRVVKVWMHHVLPEALALERKFPFEFLSFIAIPLVLSSSGLAYMVWWWRESRKEKKNA